MMSEIERDADRVRALLGDLFFALRQRFKLLVVLSCLLLVVFVALLYPRQQYYQATALIKVSSDSLDDALTPLRSTTMVGLQAALTEAAAIQSPDVLQKALDSLGLDHSTVFLDPGPSRLDSLLTLLGWDDLASTPDQRIADFEQSVQLAATEAGRDPAEMRALSLMGKITDNLTVEPSGQSNVIEVSYLSRSPQIAAAVANAIAVTYIQQQRQRLHDRFDGARDWYSAQIDDARKSILDLEREKQNRTLDRTREGISKDAAEAVIASLTTEIAAVETEVVREQDRLASLQRAAAPDTDILTLLAAAQLTGDQTIIDSSQQIREALSVEQHLGTTQHSASVEAGAVRLRRDITAYVAGRTDMLGYREAYLEKLRQQVNDKTAALSELAVSASEDTVIDAEAALSHDRLQMLTTRASDLGSAAQLAEGQAELAGLASAPIVPAGKGLLVRLVVAAVAAGSLALATALALGLLDSRVSDGGRLSDVTGLRRGPILPPLTRGRSRDFGQRKITAFVDEIAQRLAGQPVGLVTLYATHNDAEARAAFEAFAVAFTAQYPARRVKLVRADLGEIPQEVALRASRLSEGSEAIGSAVVSALAGGAGVRRFTPLVDLAGPGGEGGGENRRQSLSVLCYAGGDALPAAAEAMKLSDAAVVLVRWHKLPAADLQAMPEFAAISRRNNAYGALYAASRHAARRDR